MTKDERRKQEAVARIARETLELETLKPRGRDQLDFHELSVWRLREALERAYEAGREAGHS